MSSSTVLIDGRLAARGLGIATFARSLFGSLVEAQRDMEFRWWGIEESPWSRRVVFRTLWRSGVFDFDPRLDPRTRNTDVFHFACNNLPVHPPRNSVVTVHDLMFLGRRDPMSRFQEVTFSRGLERVGQIVAISAATQESLCSSYRIPAERVTVIPHGSTPKDTTAGAPDHFLLLAGDEPRKRTELAFAAYSEYRRLTEERLPLVVAARAFPDKVRLRMLIGETEGVVVSEDPSHTELGDLMSRSAALLYLSKEEGFGLPLIEAAEHRRWAIVCADAKIPREVRGANCMYAEPDPADVARSMLASVKRGPAPQLSGRPTWADVANEYESVYRRVLEGSK
jgi:glycosyltransferase involved in cell wall biosynthesis